MKILGLTISLVLFFASNCLAEEKILKWCNGERLAFSTFDLSYKGFSPCGELSIAKLCDTSGNRVFGNIKPYGVLKDCSIGPRITIFSQHDSYKAPRVEVAAVEPEYEVENFQKPQELKANPLRQVGELKEATESYLKNYDQYLKSLDKMIDGAELSPEAEQNLTNAREKLRNLSESYANY